MINESEKGKLINFFIANRTELLLLKTGQNFPRAQNWPHLGSAEALNGFLKCQGNKRMDRGRANYIFQIL